MNGKGCSYCGCGSEIKKVSDAANVIMIGVREGLNLFRERQCRVEHEAEIFGRQADNYRLSAMEGKREVDYS